MVDAPIDVKVEPEIIPKEEPGLSTESTATAEASSATSFTDEKKTDIGPPPTVEGKSSEEVQTLLFKAAKQVYFYFSDSNLPVDKFFFSLTMCNPEGWVPIKTIISFKRMRDYLPYGVPFVAYALRQAAAREGKAPLIAVSEDGENVRRKAPLEPVSSGFTRSAYIKGFGEGDTDENTQEKIEEYCEQFGAINAVRKRREDVGDAPGGKGKGKFKGSVFVEFTYKADLEAFLNKESLPKFLPDGPDMLFMSKEAYTKMKAKEKGIPESEIHTNRKQGKSTGGGKFNAFRELEKMKKGESPNLAKIREGTAVVGSPLVAGADGKGAKKRGREEDDQSEQPAKAVKQEPRTYTITYNGVELECDLATGTVIDTDKIAFKNNSSIKFPSGGEGADWKKLKDLITENGIPEPFLAYPPGAKGGTVAKKSGDVITEDELKRLNDAKLPFGDITVEFTYMTEDEQRAFWTTRVAFASGAAARRIREEDQSRGSHREHRGGRGGRGGRGRGGRGGRGGNRGGRDRGDRSGGDATGASQLPPVVKAAAEI
ncbi:hypothetical protein TREMEDRAFT_37957 [Tremella mesenterica DSM 1558]|uniref:uncharacterized protein n=1 Tax=Tremella mesenterica (strain ATCC 24925 / CBS 8224 / DSM 1558 / NBRC 9311 / NRRL Y-6157 / RJB 2259-6 / UBC 559-6) TaxID=578456 RepID=UPI0003F4A5BD|nr:uncharacterized protein TREMEDRAFT_37957 [Tremella mesenterica DSM 1558]EIW71598.1 hypothetical protein TREMEDRAFT_37957 [Tremella mesenterica DSM 1558]